MKHSRVTAVSLVACIVASLAGALPAQGANVQFIERVISTTADRANSVYATDLDGDGDIDVLSASPTVDKIAWYENDGGSPPAFTEHVISTTADLALSVYATDLDGDGDIDVLSASGNDDTIAWYENDGAIDPTFTERVISTTADGAVSVFAADMDGDGDTDIVAGSWNDDTIAWYENDGAIDPTFTERVISTTADVVNSVYAADVDGDGDIDVLSGSLTDRKIAWYENNGAINPTFTERVISAGVREGNSVFATDVDGDGDIDVLSASFSPSTIIWYENNGAMPPAFTERVISIAANRPVSVYATDVDGDGDTDVLSALFDTDTIAWYENDGAMPPTFTERVISTSAGQATAVFATDLDGDGDIDVLSASKTENKIAWYEYTRFPVVYVDFASGGPSGTGAEGDPVDSLGAALTLVEIAGIVRINEGSTSETKTIDQAVTLERNGPSGSVIIGDAPTPPARSGFISRRRIP